LEVADMDDARLAPLDRPPGPQMVDVAAHESAAGNRSKPREYREKHVARPGPAVKPDRARQDAAPLIVIVVVVVAAAGPDRRPARGPWRRGESRWRRRAEQPQALRRSPAVSPEHSPVSRDADAELSAW